MQPAIRKGVTVMGRISRSVVSVGGLLLCLIGGTGVVAADTAGAHTGDPGRHYLADNEDHPGVKCLYSEDFELERVRVRPPFLYARNVSRDVDTQLVGWRIIVQRADIGGGSWTAVAKSSIATVIARDDQPATLKARTLRLDGHAGSSYRIVVKMLWYEAPDGAFEGTAKHRVDWYTGAAFMPSFGPGGYCPGGAL
jgi:hypothetical protein